ncbi:MAG: hypothetical protein H6582_01150 [Crocinitomicaceae bacterium]|nr:hypothetical protein [Crocinitomicaceae bacterium]
MGLFRKKSNKELHAGKFMDEVDGYYNQAKDLLISDYHCAKALESPDFFELDGNLSF